MDGQTMTELLAAADRGMYQEKRRAGRNDTPTPRS